MIIFGTSPTYASHIVYKVPHNYQVLLEIHFDEVTQARYLEEKARHPDEQYILLLDAMDISEIASVDKVTGRLFRENASGEEAPVADEVVLPRAAYRVIYFNEVPMPSGS